MNNKDNDSLITTDTYENICGNNNELINKTKKLILKLPKEVQSDLDSLSDMIKNLQNNRYKDY